MFSEKEEELLKFIKKKPITIAELVKKMYGEDPPFEANKIIAAMVNRIVGKINYNGGAFTVKSWGGGRAGKAVWREDI